jgi:hypothetical protein
MVKHKTGKKKELIPELSKQKKAFQHGYDMHTTQRQRVHGRNNTQELQFKLAR